VRFAVRLAVVDVRLQHRITLLLLVVVVVMMVMVAVVVPRRTLVEDAAWR